MSESVFAVPAPENFPQFELIFSDGKLEPFLQRIEQRRSALRPLTAGPDGRRAKAALAAFETAVALVERIDRIRQTAATSAVASRQLERGTTK